MTRNKKLIFGVTGNSGAGKSLVSGFFKEIGGRVADADEISRLAVRPGQPAYYDIIRLFGEGVLLDNGEVNRQALGRIVFNDISLKKQLEIIVHTQVIKTTEAITLEALDNPKNLFVVWDAPLLYEAGMHKRCDVVFLVDAPRELRLARISARDDVAADMAELRLNAQPSADYLLRAITDDFVKVYIIRNQGSIKRLRADALDALKDYFR